MIKSCFGELRDILKYIFDLSLQTGIFPDPLKISNVPPIFKTGDLTEIRNYRPISVLSCFSNILEDIMRFHLYSCLVNEKIINSKQLHAWGFY